MLLLKNNPVGVDWHIQQLQNKLHASLITKWDISDDTALISYGRCDRNKRLSGYFPEVFTSNSEYKDVAWDDAKTVISFFGLGNSIKVNLQMEADVHLVYFVNLKKLALKDKTGTLILHRSDEEARADVINIIGAHSFGFTHVSTELGVVNCLKEYDGLLKSEGIQAKMDMAPTHCFRLNLKLRYNVNKNC